MRVNRPLRAAGIVSALGLTIWLFSEAAPTAQVSVAIARDSITEASVRGHMEMLASDALQGRASTSRDEWIAATYVASVMRRAGLEPLGDNGSFIKTIQVPPAAARGRAGAAPPDPPAEPRRTWNVIAQIKGRSSVRADEIILVSAHLDHVGVRGTEGDVVYNGADDDASGTTAVIELAVALSRAARPLRTIVFAWFGSEEIGGFGSRDFVENPPMPLERIIANLQFEMIGRPDPAVPPGTLWLTGYERSNLGQELARRGARIVADPHPAQNFFFRSDNIRLAYRGVVAHTVSSFGLHTDYHQPSDEIAGIDFSHMTRAIRSLVVPIRALANSPFKPEWTPNGRPIPRSAPPQN